jgi:hypothetical protein
VFIGNSLLERDDAYRRCGKQRAESWERMVEESLDETRGTIGEREIEFGNARGAVLGRLRVANLAYRVGISHVRDTGNAGRLASVLRMGGIAARMTGGGMSVLCDQMRGAFGGGAIVARAARDRG